MVVGLLAALAAYLGLQWLWSGGQEMDLDRWQAQQQARLEAERNPRVSLERRLRRAGVPAAALGTAALTALVMWTMTHSVAMAALASTAGFLVPGWIQDNRKTVRLAAVGEQIGRATTMIVAQVRQGVFLGKAIDSLAGKFPDPLGPVLDEMAAQLSMGRPLQDVFAWARAHPVLSESRDYDMFISHLAAAHERGGTELPQSLQTLRDILAAKRKHRQTINQQVSGQFSSIQAVIALGLILQVVLSKLAPDLTAPMLASAGGRLFLLGSVLGTAMLCRLLHFVKHRKLQRT